MKILHIISSGGMYGAEAVILNVSRILNEGPYRSSLGVFSNSSKPNLQLHETATKEGIESHLIACKGTIDRSVPATIRQLVNRTGADVVHAHGYKADVYVYLAMRGSQTPIVSTCHNWIGKDAAVRFYGMVDRLVLRSYAGVVAVSEEVKQRLLRAGVKKERIHLIRNGVDLRLFDRKLPQPRNERVTDCPLVVGLAGRLSQEKGVDLFLRAAAGVLLELPHTRFLVVGDGPDRAELTALIEKLGIGENVSLLGRSDNMPSFYASLDILVSSSRLEGLPIGLLEGMASRLPLVATAVGAVPEVVQEGHTGILVPAENVDALTTAIVELLRDPMLRDRYGEAARELVAAEFSAKRMTAEYLRLYEEVLTRKKSQTV